MKSEIEINEKKGFPKLMRLLAERKVIVFFEQPEQGMIVYSESTEDYEKLGDFNLSWKMDRFKDFHGKITLSN